MKITSQTKYNLMSVFALSLVVAALSTPPIQAIGGLRFHPMFYLYMLLGVLMLVVTIKQTANAKRIYAQSAWSKYDVTTLKAYVIYAALTIGNFFAALSESGFQYEKGYSIGRAYCLSPVCFEGRGIGMYLIIGASLFMLYRLRKNVKES